MDASKAAALMEQKEGADEYFEEGDDYWEENGEMEKWEGDEGWGDEEEDEWGEGEEEEDWEDGEDDELFDENGQRLRQIRPQQGGANRMSNVGLHTIEIYTPQFYFKQIDMEEYDAQPDRYGPSVIGKYTKGIGMIEGRLPTDDEDPVSFCMSVTHRLLDRMEKEGFNETFKFTEDGSTLSPWKAVGRLDIGSESLIDRSKSMKAYVMDLFERYGDGESNIEGVDMYNACYGGQAAGLAVQNWVESDRWDGRYGVAISTDISDAPHMVAFCIGAACTAGLYYPDAPLPHHSHRVSCIQHRFDFFKPIGWFHMGPIVDGKYSIDAYMNCVDTCYLALKKKMNDRPLFEISDYNVFHTGGGWHVVKKAFERFMRIENPKMPQEDKMRNVEERLIPSSNILKIVGACHTVSSWLNISSVNMTKWDQALGKILHVFTYGSGCASSLFQLRFDDLLWQAPLAVWKARNFYRNAIYLTPKQTQMHDIYIETWMKFDFRPRGRKTYDFGPEHYELDAYYLMEIDPWGRRFYHRGGMRTGPVEGPQHDNAVNYDRFESRKTRKHFGDLPTKNNRHDPVEQKKTAMQALEEKWKELEFDMTYDAEADIENQPEIVQEGYQKGIPDHHMVVVHKPEPKKGIERDDVEHTYQVVGSWSDLRDCEEMQRVSSDGTFVFEVTLGANAWEQFYLLQDGDWSRKIYPAFPRSWKDMPCVGPHKGKEEQTHCWLISGLPNDELPDEDLGSPGDRYLVTFKWGGVKTLTWEKMEGRREFDGDKGTYYVSGSWTCWDFVPLTPDPDRPGNHCLEVQKSQLGLEFQIFRDRSPLQLIYPDVDEGFGDRFSKAAMLGEGGKDKFWSVEGEEGEAFRLVLWRDPGDLSDIAVCWEGLGSRPLAAVADRYFLVGTPSGFSKDGCELRWNDSAKGYICEVQLTAIPTEFQILQNKRWDACICPDRKQCSQVQAHEVRGPGPRIEGNNWHIGKSAADKASIGDRFLVQLVLEPLKVSWKKSA